MADDDMIDWNCPCCDTSLRMTRENAERIASAVELRYGQTHRRDGVIQVSFDAGKLPDDIDLTGPVDAATIRRVVTLCVKPVAPAGRKRG